MYFFIGLEQEMIIIVILNTSDQAVPLTATKVSSFCLQLIHIYLSCLLPSSVRFTSRINTLCLLLFKFIVAE